MEIDTYTNMCIDFLVIPLVFYVVVAAKKLDLHDLRTAGWIFDMGSSVHEPWYQFYNYFGGVFFSPAFVCTGD